MKVMFANLSDYPHLLEERKLASQVYLKLLNQFCHKYSDRQEIQEVKELAVSRLVYWLLFPPMPESWVGILNEVRKVYPNWVGAITHRFPSLLRSWRQKGKLWNVQK